MAVRKMAAKPSAEDLRIADRVRRARAAQPPRDPTGEHHEAVADIARECGRDVVDMLDAWDEFAAIREYDGCKDRAEAERLAVEDVRSAFVRQRSLL